MSEPHFKIKDKVYPVPQNERLGELRLIERVTGISHREFRVRAIDQQERLAAIDPDAEVTLRQVLELLDDLVTLARIAQAVQRANPSWNTERVAAFVDSLDEGDVVMEGGEEAIGGPPAEGATSAPNTSQNGTEPAEPSRSDSGTASSESTTQQPSGHPTSAT